MLGKPEESETYLDGEDATEAWYYWSRGFTVHFDADAEWRLSTIEVDHADAVLAGQRLVGMNLEQVRAALPQHALEWDGDEMEPIDVDAWSMFLWIENGVLTQIQWWVPIGDDDRELWPEAAACSSNKNKKSAPSERSNKGWQAVDLSLNRRFHWRCSLADPYLSERRSIPRTPPTPNAEHRT